MLPKDKFLLCLVGFVLVAFWVFDVGRAGAGIGRLVSVRSTVNQQKYLVLDTDNKQEAANLLSKVQAQAQQLLDKFQMQPATIPPEFFDGVQRLLRMRLDLRELDSSVETTVAYNQNKGEAIYLCLRANPPSNKLADQDVLLSVLLHEMAHAMIVDYLPMQDGHTIHDANFKKHERFLTSAAASLALLSPSAVLGRSYCKIRIPDPDYSV